MCSKAMLLATKGGSRRLCFCLNIFNRFHLHEKIGQSTDSMLKPSPSVCNDYLFLTNITGKNMSTTGEMIHPAMGL